MSIQKHNPTGSLVNMLSVGVLILAVSAVFLPWFRWSDHTWRTAGGRWLNTTNLNYLLPTMAVGTDEAIGAQTEAGRLALNIGRAARTIVLILSVLSFWRLLRDRTGIYQLFIPVLLLFVFLCLFGYVALNILIVERVVLEDVETLPYITALEWSGPVSLTGAVLLQIIAWLAQCRIQTFSNRIEQRH